MSAAATPSRLSVAIIVRDAEEALGETLESVRSIADEIVVVDTGSTDDSRKVAERAGAQVFVHPWQDDFSAARNLCLSHVQGQWLLWLDAGERLSKEDASQLRSFVSTSADNTKAYAMVIQVPPRAPQQASEQIARIRLVPNRPGIRFAGRVRESMTQSLVAEGMEIEGLPYRIARGPGEHDVHQKAAKARRNVRLADLEIKEQGPQPHLLNCLGDAFQTLNDLDRCTQFFRHAVQGAERGSVDMLEAYYGLLTSLDSDEKNREEQLQLAVQASEVFPLDAQLLCAMGGYLQALGCTDLAEKSYHTAFHYGQINAEVWHVAEVRDIAVICLSITLQLQSKLDLARQALEAAVAENEGSVRLRRHLIEVYIKCGLRDEALEQVSALPRDTPRREALRSAVRGACLGVQQNWIAARAYLKTAFTAGCQETFCLRWFVISLLSCGEVDEARAVLLQWRTLEPQSDEVAKYLASLDQQSSDQTQPDSQIVAPEDTTLERRQWRIDAPIESPKKVAPPTSTTAATNQVRGNSPGRS